MRHLARLRPRHTVLSPLTTFAKEDPDPQLALGGTDLGEMPELSHDVPATFVRNAATCPEFEKLHIPAITWMGSGGSTRNVIRVR